MHHVRKLSDLNPKLSEVDRIMVKARRKQVPGWLPKGWFLPPLPRGLPFAGTKKLPLEHHKNETQPYRAGFPTRAKLWGVSDKNLR
jgi:hypothetical protein